MDRLSFMIFGNAPSFLIWRLGCNRFHVVAKNQNRPNEIPLKDFVERAFVSQDLPTQEAGEK
jgi:hypothetical protein